VYTTVNEPIQQHTAVYNHSRLWWTVMNLRLHQTVTHFYSSKVRRPFRSQVQFFIVAAFSVNSVDSDEGIWGKNNLIFIELGKINFILLTEWHEESYKCLRWSDISSNPSLKLFIPHHIPSLLFVILSIKVSSNQSRHPHTAAKWLNVHTIAQWPNVCCYVLFNSISHVN
jgi:hypothetical protein